MHTCAPHNLCIYWAIQVEVGVEVRLKCTHDGLCKELPARVAQLILAEGGRLAK